MSKIRRVVSATKKSTSKRRRCFLCGEKLSQRAFYNHQRFKTCVRKRKRVVNVSRRSASVNSSANQSGQDMCNLDLDNNCSDISEEEIDEFEINSCHGKFEL